MRVNHASRGPRAEHAHHTRTRTRTRARTRARPRQPRQSSGLVAVHAGEPSEHRAQPVEQRHHRFDLGIGSKSQDCNRLWRCGTVRSCRRPFGWMPRRCPGMPTTARAEAGPATSHTRVAFSAQERRPSVEHRGPRRKRRADDGQKCGARRHDQVIGGGWGLVAPDQTSDRDIAVAAADGARVPIQAKICRARQVVISTVHDGTIRRHPRRGLGAHARLDSQGYDYADCEQEVRRRRIVPHVRRRGEPPLVGCVRGGLRRAVRERARRGRMRPTPRPPPPAHA